MTPRSIAMARMPWTIGKMPAFLMSIASEATPTVSIKVVSTPSAGVSKLSIRLAKRADQRAFAAHHLDQRRLGLRPAGRSAGDRDRVEEDRQVHRRLRRARP